MSEETRHEIQARLRDLRHQQDEARQAADRIEHDLFVRAESLADDVLSGGESGGARERAREAKDMARRWSDLMDEMEARHEEIMAAYDRLEEARQAEEVA